MTQQAQGDGLKRTLGPVMLWGLGVGYVISGEYFGWNLGLPHGGPYGMLAATALVTVMYVSFVLSYAEVACAMPRAGGAFVYASRAFGPGLGFLAGLAQLIEFVIAPSAIAFAIGDYARTFWPDSSPLLVAMGAYVLFTAINIHGVALSALLELGITLLAVVELLIFAGVTAPHVSWEAFSLDPLPNGWSGIFPALPFAIWFYLAIEGVANVAEETRDPQKNIARGFSAAMITLVALALITFVCAVGVGGWHAIVTDPSTGAPSDRPLPLALAQLDVGPAMFHLLVTVGLFGLIASFHGILLAAGRATFEFGRVGYLPRALGTIHPRRKTPWVALLVNMLVGFVALLSGRTSELITLSVMGALTLYILSMLALLRLRRAAPDMPRPYRAPLYPLLPLTALSLAILCMGAVITYNASLALIYAATIAAGYAYFYLVVPEKTRAQGALD